MAFDFLKDCTDPAELAERLRVLNGPDADAIDPGGALRREAATLDPSIVPIPGTPFACLHQPLMREDGTPWAEVDWDESKCDDDDEPVRYQINTLSAPQSYVFAWYDGFDCLPILTFHRDGRMELGDTCTPDEGARLLLDSLRRRFARPKVRALVEAAKGVLDAADAGRIYERGAGGMTIEAQIRRSFYNAVPAWPFEELRAALRDLEDGNG